MSSSHSQSLHLLKSRVSMGVIPAMATPIALDGLSVNVPVVKQLIDFLISSGVIGVFVGGTTGEGVLLSIEQRKILHETTIDAIDGQIPALIHVGTNTTDGSTELARHAERIQASAIVAITPFFYPIEADDLIVHYKTIADAAPTTPLFAYDIPQLAINSISPSLLVQLTEEIPSFAGLKSSQPNAQEVRQLIDAAGEDSIILAGNERVALGLLSLGADGLISGLSTAVPEPFVELVKAFGRGDINEAQHYQRKINQLLDLFPGKKRLGAIKTLLAERGIPVGSPILPRRNPTLDENLWIKMSAVLEDLVD